jgi:uncharacterized protein YndB with AHSA1/START domain
MLVRISIALLILILGILLYAAMKPDSIRVQRSTEIKAQPEKVFALINDLKNWSRWEPQDRKDPSLKRTFSGAESGKGAESDWQGSGQAGKGKMLIVESLPPSRVVVQVDFERPFEAHNVNQFVLVPAGEMTNITWTMQGTNVYILKLMSVFMNTDKIMGAHFEEGLRNLKQVAEQ